MKSFVARSLHFVARCTPYTVATCNEREFPGGLTPETSCCTTATNALKKKPFVAVKNNFVAAVARFVAPRFPIANTSAMNGIEALTLRVREVRGDANPTLRISPPVALIDEMIDKFISILIRR